MKCRCKNLDCLENSLGGCRLDFTECPDRISSYSPPVCYVPPEIDLDKADDLVKNTEYAFMAVEEDDPINWGDASSFFIEGYNYARKLIEKHNA